MQHDEYTEGWTAPIEYYLKHDGETFNASGMTPDLVLTDKSGNVVAVKGTVTWADENVSKIRFTPDPTDFDASLSPYKLHWKVTENSSPVAIAFYPQGEPILIEVYPA
jgi:hypothetical protein